MAKLTVEIDLARGFDPVSLVALMDMVKVLEGNAPDTGVQKYTLSDALAEPAVESAEQQHQKRTRRTKAEMDAARAAEAKMLADASAPISHTPVSVTAVPAPPPLLPQMAPLLPKTPPEVAYAPPRVPASPPPPPPPVVQQVPQVAAMPTPPQTEVLMPTPHGPNGTFTMEQMRAVAESHPAAAPAMFKVLKQFRWVPDSVPAEHRGYVIQEVLKSLATEPAAA